MEVNKMMKVARKRAKKSQKEIGLKLHMTSQQYSLYETGRREMPISKLIEFCKECNTSPNEICGWNEAEDQNKEK